MLAKTIHSLFIPNVKACHRPKALTHKWLKFYSLALLSHILLSVSFYSGPGLVTENLETMKSNIINLTNVERTQSNLSELKENEVLDKAAKAKLDDMFANNYWDHVSPEGRKPWDFIDENNYTYTYAGENLAKGYIDSESTVKAWMESTSHKENILSPRYSEIGVAIGTGKINGKPTTLVVQMFGKPKGTQLASAGTDALVLGEKTTNKIYFNSQNASMLSRAPFFIIWFALLLLILFDGVMLRKCGLHRSKKHLFEFRSALLINCLALVFLTANYAAIA